MRLLVCGGGDFIDRVTVSRTLMSLPFTPSLVIHGDAAGADKLAGNWARANRIHEVKVPALWDCYKHAAGLMRNAAMLELAE